MKGIVYQHVKERNIKISRAAKIVLFGFAALAISLFILSLIIIPPGGGHMKQLPKTDGSIFERISLNAGDTHLGMIIQAQDDTAPVIMFLGGGPGFPSFLMENLFPTDMSKHFVMCYPDYRGSGLSFSTDIQANQMTSTSYVERLYRDGRKI